MKIAFILPVFRLLELFQRISQLICYKQVLTEITIRKSYLEKCLELGRGRTRAVLLQPIETEHGGQSDGVEQPLTHRDAEVDVLPVDLIVPVSISH